MKLPSFILASLSAYKDTNIRQFHGVSISDHSKLSDSDLTNNLRNNAKVSTFEL